MRQEGRAERTVRHNASELWAILNSENVSNAA